MGAWGPKIFDNDTACDWTADCVETDDLAFIEHALNHVLETGDEYLESDLAEAALAAAETVARLKGNPGPVDAYSAPIDAWVASKQIDIPASLVTKAIATVERVQRAPSELLELWQDSDELEAWTATQSDLKKRLAA